MAQLVNVKLSRYDNTPWGFRLQGGKDFGTPLVIQKVTAGSLAEKAGLSAGDAILRINATDASVLRHKDAQDYIVRAGNSFDLAVQRGGSTWKPNVAPVGPAPVHKSPTSGAPAPVTKTSLAYRGPAAKPIGTGHNVSAKPFAGQPHLNGSSEPKLVNKQYNSPIGIYSEQSIAETLSAQAEVLAGGVLGVNFKKNEKDYNAANSEVFKMVQEADKEPRTPEPDVQGVMSAQQGSGIVTSPNPGVAGLRHVAAPETRAPSTPQDPFKVLPPGQNICAECERLIVGVFVRIKEKNLHVECFKCATCGSSLKNVGYYNINNKLYCDIHAKLVARQQAPAPGLEPVTVPPGQRAPAGTILSALANAAATAPLSPLAPSTTATSFGAPLSPGLGSPQPGTIAPLPFHAPRVGTSHVSAPKTQTPTNISGPRPFSTQTSNFASRPAPGLSTIRPLPKLRGGAGGASKGGVFAGASAPTRGRGVLNPATSGARIPLCGSCNQYIRGPFITALGRIWCPNHFVCANGRCNRPLQDIGFVEEKGQLYCEFCFEQYIAPACSKCAQKIKGDCLNAISKHFHPECFNCVHCGKLFGNSPFFLEDGHPYCEADWNELFTTKCFACGFPIEAGDRWVEALQNNYHSQCFNCTMCKKNLEGESFFAKGGRPFCRNHAR